MLKRDELTDPNSCMSKARDDEMTFVLLGRDPAAPVAIRAWIGERLRLGKNTMEDQQIQDATRCMIRMEQNKNRGLVVVGVVTAGKREVDDKKTVDSLFN